MEEAVGSIHNHEQSKLLAKKNTSKLNSRQNPGFNTHGEIKNVLEENTDKVFHDLGTGRDYRHDINLETIKEKNNKFENIKNLKFPYSKNSVNRVKR